MYLPKGVAISVLTAALLAGCASAPSKPTDQLVLNERHNKDSLASNLVTLAGYPGLISDSRYKKDFDDLVNAGALATTLPNDLNVSREGANKQVISSQADSLIKISRIWADFFPANTSNQPV